MLTKHMSGILAKAQDAAGDGLSCLHYARGNLFPHLRGASELEGGQPVFERRWQGLLDLIEINVEVNLVVAHALVEIGPLLDQ